MSTQIPSFPSSVSTEYASNKLRGAKHNLSCDEDAEELFEEHHPKHYLKLVQELNNRGAKFIETGKFGAAFRAGARRKS